LSPLVGKTGTAGAFQNGFTGPAKWFHCRKTSASSLHPGPLGAAADVVGRHSDVAKKREPDVVRLDRLSLPTRLESPIFSTPVS
jgi:hypothetical protein